MQRADMVISSAEGPAAGAPWDGGGISGYSRMVAVPRRVPRTL
ncbi:MAG TPA: hypothetical protein PLH92_10320 [Mycobacterium sp.]|nr:hypothetical protein [Mycobacterium sp.]HQC77103.1 hypothetical protein [Mycobacterium sp.]